MEAKVCPHSEVWVDGDDERLKLYKLVMVMVMVEGGAVRRFCPCATYETKTVSSPIVAYFNPYINKVQSVNGKWLGCWRSTHLCLGDL